TLAPIDRDHPVLVNHLVAQGHPVPALNELVIAAVPGRHHRTGYAARDAAIVEPEVLIAVEGADRIGVAAHTPSEAGLRPGALPRLLRQRRNLPVRRID